MERYSKTKLAIKMGLVALPMALVGILVSTLAVSTYKDYKPGRIVSAVTQNGLTAILGESTDYMSPGMSYPSTCPAPYTGTPPNCQAPASYTYPTDGTGGSSTTTQPPTQTYTSPTSGTSGSTTPTSGSTTTNPPSYSYPSSGSGSISQPAAGSPTTSPPTTSSGESEACCRAPGDPIQGSTGSTGSQSSGSNQGQSSGQYVPPPPTYSRSDSGSCMENMLGAEAYAKFRSGGFQPTADQIARASSCFSAQVSYGSSSGSGQSGGGSGGQSNSGPSAQSGSSQQPAYASIAIAPPPAFQADSPMVACAKSIVGDRYGSQPSAEQMDQIRSKCFNQASSGHQIGYIDPSGQGGRDGSLPGVAISSVGPGDKAGSPPSLPPEVKACVIKAGMSESTIAAIQRGQSPTAAQQQQGESCFNQYAKDKGYTPPMLTPPDPTQPFDPSSKQNQCADLVAQTHGIRVNQINPGIVATWSADDISKMRSCYGVSPTTSAGNNTMAFAPTSPQVAVASSKLSCIEQAVGADKLAAVVAGTASINDSDRRTVYDKCINPTKIAANADPALLGILAAMPPSDLEGQFIPVDAQILPAPTAAGTSQTSADAEVAIGGEVNVAAGTTLPTKIDVFVKSTPQTFTVSLKKITATKATWTINVGQNKLPLGNHKAYAVATLADATQTRSPDASFDITAAKATKNNVTIIVAAAAGAVALVLGAWMGWRWHHKQPLLSFRLPWRKHG
ncbi:hypothetical protein HYW36_00325 [Candidatus Saccharibacteria bacterium]|nr:hypothetical protein [Candidatus Saccharibacteria bacterium]